VVPAEPGKGSERAVVTESLTGDADIRATIVQQRLNLLRRPLNQLKTNLGKQRAERFNHRRQAAGLRMRCRNRQHAGCVIREKISEAAHIARLVENTFGYHQQRFTRLGHPQQPFAPTDENLNPQLFFKLADMTTHPGLRCIEHVGDFGQIIIPARRFPDNFQLLEIHLSLGPSDMTLLLKSEAWQNK
jgi:hypothetical protein